MFEEDYNHYRLLTDTHPIGAAVQTILLAALTIGYPNQSPYPRPRKLLKEIVEWI